MRKNKQRFASFFMLFLMLVTVFQPAMIFAADADLDEEDAKEITENMQDDTVEAVEIEEEVEEVTEEEGKVEEIEEEEIVQEEKEPVKNKGDPVIGKEENQTDKGTEKEEVLEETKKEKNQNKSAKSVERAGEFKDEVYNLPYGSMVEIGGEIYTWVSSYGLPNDAKEIGEFETTSGEVIYLDKDKNVIKEGVLTYEGTHTLFTLCELEIIPAFMVYEKDNKKYLRENDWREGCAPVDQLVAKTDAESGKVIEGAIFEIVDADNNVIEEVTGGVINLNKLTLTKYDGTNYVLKENEVLHSYVGSYGEAYVPKEPYKEDEVYTIREKEAPEGYVKADKEFRFKVKKSTLTWEGTTYIVHDIKKEDGKYFERIYFPNKKAKPNDLKIIKKKGDKNPEIEFIKEITESQQKLNQLIEHWEKQDYKEEDFQYTVIDKYGDGEQRVLYFDIGAWSLHATPYKTVISAVEELIDEAKNDEDLTDKKADKIFNQIVSNWKGATECADCNRWEILEGPKPMPEFIFTPEDDNVLKGELSGAKFEIKNSKGEVIHTVTTNEDGVATIKDIKAGDYTIREVEAPNGYILDEQEYPITVKGDSEGVITFTAYNESIPLTPLEPAKTSVDVEKVWKGKAQESVTINLLADGKKVDSVKLSKDNGWKHTFTDLPVVNDVKDEQAIVYTVEEVEIDGYEVSIDGNAEDGFVVTNTEIVPPTPIVPAKTSVDVEKVWKGKVQKSVTINLLADGKKVDSVKLSDDNDWKHTFTDLPVVNDVKDEQAIVYTVEEVEIDGYEVSINGNAKDGFVVTNTEIVPPTPIVPAKTSVDVEKVWKGKAQESVTINLLADGKKVDSVKLSDENNWKHTFTDLPVVKDIKDEKAIEYMVEEVEIEGYKVSIDGNAKDGFVVTNTEIIPPTPLEPAKTSVDVEKVWEGEKQDSVTINLLADGKKVDSVKLSDENDWKHTFTDLPVVNDIKDEKAIEYTVEEVEIDGYEVSIDGNAKDGFVVTNTEIIPVDPPVHPEEPTEPEKPVDPEELTPEELTKVEKLPQTGNKTNYMYSLAGLALLLIGGFTFYRNRKKSIENNS